MSQACGRHRPRASRMPSTPTGYTSTSTVPGGGRRATAKPCVSCSVSRRCGGRSHLGGPLDVSRTAARLALRQQVTWMRSASRSWAPRRPHRRRRRTDRRRPATWLSGTVLGHPAGGEPEPASRRPTLRRACGGYVPLAFDDFAVVLIIQERTRRVPFAQRLHPDLA